VSLQVLGTPDTAGEWEDALRAELAAMLPVWERFKARFGRTTVGLSRVNHPKPGLLSRSPSSMARCRRLPAHATSALALRFLADDLKALYCEAVQADGGPPSARQIDGWFWRETIAGAIC